MPQASARDLWGYAALAWNWGVGGRIYVSIRKLTGFSDNTWILDKNRVPVREPNLLKWARWFENANRTVENTVLDGNIRISTVFVGTDMSYNTDYHLLYETMVFGLKDDNGYEISNRYATEAQAKLGHQLIREEVINLLENREDFEPPTVGNEVI